LAGLLEGGGASASPAVAWVDPRFGKAWSLTPAEDELVVRFAPAADSLERALLAARWGLTVERPFSEETSAQVFRSPAEDAVSVCAAVAADPMVRCALPAYDDQEGYRKYCLADEATVRFREGVSTEEAVSRIHALGASVVRAQRTPGYFTIRVPQGEGPFDTIRSLVNDPAVLFAEPSCLLFDDLLSVPNDPYFPLQWSEANVGQNGWWPGADVEAPLAWEITKGDPNVVICTVDTGMDLAHEDLAENLLPRGTEDWDFVDADGSPDDQAQHGTAVAGIAVAVQDNGRGVSGIAPHCRIMPLRVVVQSGQNQSRADAINYAASRRGEFIGLVISISWELTAGDFTAVHDAIAHAVEVGCLVACASGNTDGPVRYPARYPESIACGASSPCDERKSPVSCDLEQNWGSCFGPELDVIAPGVKIPTTDRMGGAGYVAGNYLYNFNGTSSAAPLVAGVLALIWSADPSLDAAEVRATLESTAEDQVGPPLEDAPGWDPYYGHGRVNALRAVLAVSDPSQALPLEEDMEGAAPGWSHAPVVLGSADPWHLTQGTNHTPGGTSSYFCGDWNAGYPLSTHAALVTPLFRPAADTYLAFWHWLDASTLDDSTAGDGAVIEISTNGGLAWDALEPTLGGYTYVIGDSTGSPFQPGTPVWSGHFGWTHVVVPLAGREGDLAIVRFRFGAGGTEPVGQGWAIDDVQIGPAGPATAPALDARRGGLSLAIEGENPFTGSIGLRYQLPLHSPVRFEILDPGGRQIRAWEYGPQPPGAHVTAWDGRDALGHRCPSGAYFVRVVAGGLTRSVRVTRIG
jgi:subtilisin family serine protease